MNEKDFIKEGYREENDINSPKNVGKLIEAINYIDNSTKLFEQKQAKMSDEELIELTTKQVSELARTGGRSHKMCVPPMITDTDMLFSELIRRFKKSLNK